MIRALVALFAAPAISSLLFGILYPVAGIFMLAITAAIAMPLFLLFRKRGWLQWWHSALVGALCGALGIGLFALGSPGWADAYALQSGIIYAGIGTATGLLFWWLGLYRNKAFPSVPRAAPFMMVAVIPIAALGFAVYQAFPKTTFHVGTITAVTGEAPSRMVTVRLGQEETITVPFRGDTRPTEFLLNQCWHLTRHWSTSQWSEVYSLAAPMGITNC